MKLKRPASADTETLTTELLILPDGRILVHNLTQPFAKLLKQLNPADNQILPRAASDSRFNDSTVQRSHEFPD